VSNQCFTHAIKNASVTKGSYHLSCQKLIDATTDAVLSKTSYTTEVVGNLCIVWDRNSDNQMYCFNCFKQVAGTMLKESVYIAYSEYLLWNNVSSKSICT